MTPAQIEAIRRIADVIVDVVKDAGELGAPSGVVYAAMMTVGCSLSQYNALINGLIRAKKLRIEGDVLFLPEKPMRTIWDSDGSDGEPLLICPPPTKGGN